MQEGTAALQPQGFAAVVKTLGRHGRFRWWPCSTMPALSCQALGLRGTPLGRDSVPESPAEGEHAARGHVDGSHGLPASGPYLKRVPCPVQTPWQTIHCKHACRCCIRPVPVRPALLQAFKLAAMRFLWFGHASAMRQNRWTVYRSTLLGAAAFQWVSPAPVYRLWRCPVGRVGQEEIAALNGSFRAALLASHGRLKKQPPAADAGATTHADRHCTGRRNP